MSQDIQKTPDQISQELAELQESGKHEWVLLEQKNPEEAAWSSTYIVVAFIFAGLFSLIFAITLTMGMTPSIYGGALGLGCFAFALGIRRLFADTFPRVTAAELREHQAPEGPKPISTIGPVKRRKFLGLAAGGGIAVVGGSFGAFGVSALSVFQGMGPAPKNTYYEPIFKAGQYLVNTQGDRVRPEFVIRGGYLSVWPEGRVHWEKSATLLVNSTEEIRPPSDLDGVIDGTIVAYSRICTHLGCPVACYRDRTDEMFCPCHQSTFLIAEAGKVVYGPAGHPLPQLPIAVDKDGFIFAKGDFIGHVGPPIGDFLKDKSGTKPADTEE